MEAIIVCKFNVISVSVVVVMLTQLYNWMYFYDYVSMYECVNITGKAESLKTILEKFSKALVQF